MIAYLCAVPAFRSGVETMSVRKVLRSQYQHWVGDGFHVFPVFSQLAFTNDLSPWLMFDYAAPEHFPPTKQRLGVGSHPHRGFETVTIAFQGGVEHADSTGGGGVIGPGDIQWMTAGSGITHNEFHSTEFAKTGGMFEMCQLWLNLPLKEKYREPSYQPILSQDVPVVGLKQAGKLDGDDVGSVRVIAGTIGETTGPAHTHSPVELWDMTLRTPDVPTEVEVPSGHNMIVFVRRGGVTVGDDTKLGAQDAAVMHREGSTLRLTATEPDTKLMLLGGKPLDQPIKAYGPFVD